MKYYVFIFLFLFGCASTKKSQTSKTSEEIKFETKVKDELFEIKRKDDLTEVITRTITTKTSPEKTESGDVVMSSEQTIEEKIERFRSTTETQDVKTSEKSDTASDKNEVEENLNKETVGQDAAKIIDSATTGLTKGVLDYLFGGVMQKVMIAILGVMVLIFLFSIRKKKSDS